MFPEKELLNYCHINNTDGSKLIDYILNEPINSIIDTPSIGRVTANYIAELRGLDYSIVEREVKYLGKNLTIKNLALIRNYTYEYMGKICHYKKDIIKKLSTRQFTALSSAVHIIPNTGEASLNNIRYLTYEISNIYNSLSEDDKGIAYDYLGLIRSLK